jgi:hypothetical protein
VPRIAWRPGQITGHWPWSMAAHRTVSGTPRRLSAAPMATVCARRVNAASCAEDGWLSPPWAMRLRAVPITAHTSSGWPTRLLRLWGDGIDAGSKALTKTLAQLLIDDHAQPIGELVAAVHADPLREELNIAWSNACAVPKLIHRR